MFDEKTSVPRYAAKNQPAVSTAGSKRKRLATVDPDGQAYLFLSLTRRSAQSVWKEEDTKRTKAKTSLFQPLQSTQVPPGTGKAGPLAQISVRFEPVILPCPVWFVSSSSGETNIINAAVPFATDCLFPGSLGAVRVTILCASSHCVKLTVVGAQNTHQLLLLRRSRKTK